MKKILLLVAMGSLASCGGDNVPSGGDGHVPNIVAGATAYAYNCPVTPASPTELHGVIQVTVKSVDGDNVSITTALGNDTVVPKSCLHN